MPSAKCPGHKCETCNISFSCTVLYCGGGWTICPRDHPYAWDEPKEIES